jgi:5-methylcytosine-specific restriction endonuclease McrA
MKASLESLSHLSDPKLLDHLKGLVNRDRRTTADLLLAIAEIDERKLWARHACPSMFVFCVRRLHMSEQMTSKRLWAARTARRYPMILEMVARGELHLAAIQRLAGHLTPANHVALLERAKHKSTREVEALVADLAPQPDLPSRVRALPRRRESGVSRDGGPTTSQAQGQPTGDRIGTDRVGTDRAGTDRLGTDRVGADRTDTDRANADRAAEDRESALGNRAQPASVTATSGDELGVAGSGMGDGGDTCGNADGNADRPAPAAKERPAAKRIIPLGARRYRIEVTVDEDTHDKLRSLQDLLARSASGTDPAAIISRAIDVLLTETLKRKAGYTKPPKAALAETSPTDRRATNEGRRARAIPAAVRRAVWRRDCGRCRYVDRWGRRCDGTRHVEFHHVVPFAIGGRHAADNIELRCAAHNQYQAELDFGRSFMAGKRGASRGPGAGAFLGEYAGAAPVGPASVS